MPRHSEETKKALEQDYLIAAELLVARRAWDAGTVREVGKAVGKSRGPIHEKFKGLGLKVALIRRAYLHPAVAIEQSPDKPETISDVLKILVEYIREDGEAAPLMVQVMALAAAQDAAGADQLQQEISNASFAAAKYLEARLGNILPHRHQRGREIRAQALVDWYVAVCATLVMGCSTSNPDLIRLAEGFRPLSDSRH